MGEPELAPPGSFLHQWTSTPEFDDAAAVHMVGDLLFVYGEDNLVAAYDTSGGLKFRTMVGTKHDVVGEPLVQPDRVVFPLSSGLEIYTREGVRRRTIPFDQPIRSPGVISGETVYIGTDSAQGGRIAAIALDRQYSVSRWTRLVGGVVHTKPAFYENILYVATDTGHVVALTTDPVILWPRSPEMPDSMFHTNGRISAAVQADEAGVFIPSSDTKLYCIDGTTGRVRWEYLSGQPIGTSPQLSSDMVYLHMPDRGLVALNKKNDGRIAKPKWIAPEGVKVLSDDAKNAYVLTNSGSIAAIDKQTGVTQFTTRRNDFIDGVAHFDPKDNTIYALAESGTLVAIQPVLRAGVVGVLVMSDSEPQQLASR
ncbi:MAG: PQQ-binding-like beta-propeller repeat protein [Burkholderiales bacterium]|nr:PQQ-binding-like beta-propeller repeat protein [Phycisphaerae bacterium]